jgi:hypothetical protein
MLCFAVRTAAVGLGYLHWIDSLKSALVLKPTPAGNEDNWTSLLRDLKG